ncbi:MAG: hypothetical protein WKF77_00450 [Planctomycetaceae bacterium]
MNSTNDNTHPTTDLEDLFRKAEFYYRRAVSESGQSAYSRRAPMLAAVAHYEQASATLLALLKIEPTNTRALLLLSLVEEGLLHFDTAAAMLSKAFESGEPRSKKHLKRFALLKSNAKWWSTISLSPFQLAALGEYLADEEVNPSNDDLRVTTRWLIENSIPESASILERLAELGAFSDFQVLANVVNG